MTDWESAFTAFAASTREKLFDTGMAFSSKLGKVYHDAKNGKELPKGEPFVPVSYERAIARTPSAIKLDSDKHTMRARL